LRKINGAKMNNRHERKNTIHRGVFVTLKGGDCPSDFDDLTAGVSIQGGMGYGACRHSPKTAGNGMPETARSENGPSTWCRFVVSRTLCRHPC
jgi:hypothetical protein